VIVDLVTSSGRSHRGFGARAVYNRQTFRCRRGRRTLDRLALLPRRRALDFGCQNWRTAAAHAFRRLNIRAEKLAEVWTVRHVSLNTYDVFLPLAAAIPGSTRELLEAPLNSQLRSHPDRRVNPYTCSPYRLVFHARGRSPQSTTLVFPRRFYQGHHCRPQVGHSCAH